MSEITDIEHAMLTYLKTFPQYKDQKISPQKFTDGWAFATILKAAQGFKISYAELIQSSEKWTFKLTNLKIIVQLIEEYFEYTINKGIKTKDIDLLEIAKNNNIQEVVKLFELVIAVVTQAPNKENHIGVIMSLDQRSQTAFVKIIQNVIENRILEKNQSKQDKIIILMDQLQTQNSLLRQQVQTLLKHNFQIQKQNDEFKLKQQDYEQQIEKLKQIPYQSDLSNKQQPSKERDHLKNLVDNLKQKLLSTVRQNQQKLSQYKEQMGMLQQKLARFNEMQQQLGAMKRLKQQQRYHLNKNRNLDNQKQRYRKIIEEKEEAIRKLENKLDQFTEINCGMQQKQVQMKMELQKKQYKCKQLEKKVQGQIYSLNSSMDAGNINSDSYNLGQQLHQNLQNQELQQLKGQLDLTKKKLRETQRDNIRMKRNMDKFNAIQAQKKKLQRLVIDLNKQKVQHMELLVQSMFQIYQKGRDAKLFT